MGSWPNILKPPCFNTTCAPLEHIPNASEAIVNSNKMLSLVLFFTNARRSVIITSDRQAPRSQGHVKELGRSGRGKCVWVEGQPREPRSPRMAGLSQAGDGGAGAGNALGRAAPREHPETQARSAAVSLGAARTVLSERCPRGPLPVVGISQKANRLRVWASVSQDDVSSSPAFSEDVSPGAAWGALSAPRR